MCWHYLDVCVHLNCACYVRSCYRLRIWPAGQRMDQKLIEYVRSVATEKSRIMIFGQWIYFAICLQALESASTGVCFGHQVIALSMGDMCSQHSATKLRLNELGKKVYRVESGVLVGVSQLPLLLCSYSHKEPSFDVLGPCSHHIIVSSDNSPNHGMVRFSQSESLGDAPPSAWPISVFSPAKAILNSQSP